MLEWKTAIPFMRSWIKEPYDADAIFQLDRYHIHQEILRKIKDKKAQKEIPEPSEGILYKHMGVQESQNCTVITMRMKHRRMRWSRAGANNLTKTLYRKENMLVIKKNEKLPTFN